MHDFQYIADYLNINCTVYNGVCRFNRKIIISDTDIKYSTSTAYLEGLLHDIYNGLL